jgi:hypothetical protein
MLAEFDQRRPRLYPPDVSQKVRRQVSVSPEVVEAARSRGLPLGEFISQLYVNQRSVRVAYVASIYRSFALLEMARVPVDPAYFDLVEGCLGNEEGLKFRLVAASGEQNALVRAAAGLLGADTRAPAVEGLLNAAQRAQVLHEGFIESARLLEATFLR